MKQVQNMPAADKKTFCFQLNVLLVRDSPNNLLNPVETPNFHLKILVDLKY
jgi:hypothetical protein